MKLFFTLFFLTLLQLAEAQTTTARQTNGSSSTTSKVTIKILKAFPNPATTYITFEFQRSYATGLSIEIFDLPGKKVASSINLQTSTTIQLQNFYRGVYVYKLLDKNKKVLESGKFQVVK